MKIIIIITAAAVIIYKTHILNRILYKLRFDGPPVPFKAEARRAAKIKNNGQPLIENTAAAALAEKQKTREQLEIQAAYIIKRQGANPYTVKYMSEDLLQAVIRDFIKEC